MLSQSSCSMNGTHLRRLARRGNADLLCTRMRRPGTKREAGDLDFSRRKRRRAKPQDNQGEGPMPVQWTAHIPQAMQRHGGSLKPEAEAEGDAAVKSFTKA